MHQNLITPILLFASTVGASPIDNMYIQYGFLGVLLFILIWYSQSSYKENVKREKDSEIEKKEIILRYEQAMKEERDRYNEIHKEIMILLKAEKNGN